MDTDIDYADLRDQLLKDDSRDLRIHNWIADQYRFALSEASQPSPSPRPDSPAIRAESPVLGFLDIDNTLQHLSGPKDASCCPSYDPLFFPSPTYARADFEEIEREEQERERALQFLIQEMNLWRVFPSRKRDQDHEERGLTGRDKPLPPPPPPSTPLATRPKPLIIPPSASHHHRSFHHQSARFPSISSTLEDLGHECRKDAELDHRNMSVCIPTSADENTPTSLDSGFILSTPTKSCSSATSPISTAPSSPVSAFYSPVTSTTTTTTPALSPTASTFSGVSSQIYLGSPSSFPSSPTISTFSDVYGGELGSQIFLGTVSNGRNTPNPLSRPRSKSSPHIKSGGVSADAGATPGVYALQNIAPSQSRWSLATSLNELHASPPMPATPSKRKRILSFFSSHTPSSSTEQVPALPDNKSMVELGLGRTKSLVVGGKRKRKLVVSGIEEGDERAYEAVKKWCESFGEVRQFSKKPNGNLHVDFRKSSVAETVCRVQAQVSIKGAGSVSLSWYKSKKSF